MMKSVTWNDFYRKSSLKRYGLHDCTLKYFWAQSLDKNKTA